MASYCWLTLAATELLTSGTEGVRSSKPSCLCMISSSRPYSYTAGATSPCCWNRSSLKQKSGYAVLLQWCSKLLELSWAQSVCVFAGCNLQPSVECELPTLCRDRCCCGCSWHLLRRPPRNEHNNVPFTGQMMSNCEEELRQEGQEKGKKDRRGWWTLQENYNNTGEKKMLDIFEWNLFHGIFIKHCWTACHKITYIISSLLF